MNILSILLITLTAFPVFKPQHIDQSSISIDVDKYERVSIYNTGGKIKVNSTNGTTATFNSKRTLKATTNKKLARAIKEFYVDTISVDGELFVFINNPEKKLRSNGCNILNYNTNNNEMTFGGMRASGIESEFEFEISLPENSSGVISTHKGDIEVNGVKGKLAILNHYGDIFLDKVHQIEHISSHHGEIKAHFDQQPSHDLSLRTHHGNITTSFRSTPSAKLELDTYHGSFFTDFDWEPIASKLELKSKNGKTKYKLGKDTNVKIGNGEHTISFKSHHGNMYILKH